jgi:hypothetical protein
MSTEEDVSDEGLVDQKASMQSTTIERFHARKFRAQTWHSSDKRVILKVAGSGSNKKQKTPNKEHMKGR